MASELAKIVAAAGLSLALGLALGGLGPRAELRAMEARLSALSEVDCGPRRLPAGLTGVLQGRPWSSGDDPVEAPVDAEPLRDVVDVDEEAREVELNVELAPRDDDIPDAPSDPEEVEDELRMAREALELRNLSLIHI